MKFLHTMIRVKDLEKSEKFYKENLGFVESRRKDFPEDEFTLLYLKLEVLLQNFLVKVNLLLSCFA